METTKRTKRFIFNDDDLSQFLASPAKSELLKLVAACGRSCAATRDFQYDPGNPLKELSPSLAVLHGALNEMKSWVDNFPAEQGGQIRFGNPAFRKWHGHLSSKSTHIVSAILSAHKQYPGTLSYSGDVLSECWLRGKEVVVAKTPGPGASAEENVGVVEELSAYFLSSFGHPVRLDYGTGHESSFQVFLYALCKIGCFGSTAEEPPNATRLKATTISIWTSYLSVTRRLQTDYMLEPAGSHGVWGLDDYHCLPFYYGACQLQSDGDGSIPSSIHDPSAVSQHDTFLYYGCISYIRSLKKGVPFFESSPMLDDISHLPSWEKVASGLLKLYEGEVLKKRQVVQHFEFGEIFKASWTPSQSPTEAPEETFRQVAEPGTAPWADKNATKQPSPMSPTRAPWAK